MNPRRVSLVVSLAALAALGAAVPAASGPTSYRVRSGDSTVAYSIQKWGVFPETGKFRDVRGAIAFDPVSPAASSIDVRVGIASLDSGIDDRNRALLSEDFFDAGRYPEMRFVSQTVESLGPASLRVTGDLTIRGRTHRITIPVTILGLGHDGRDQELVAFETRFEIDRRDYDVLGARWSGGRALLSNQVEIHLVLGASRMAAPGAAVLGR